MHSGGMKRRLFGLQGVKTGGGGERKRERGAGGVYVCGGGGSFMDILSRGKEAGGAASQQAKDNVSVSGWSARGCRRSEKQSRPRGRSPEPPAVPSPHLCLYRSISINEPPAGAL